MPRPIQVYQVYFFVHFFQLKQTDQTQKLQKRFHLQTQKLVEDWFGGATPLQSDTWQMKMSDEGIRYDDGWGQHTYEKVLAHAYLMTQELDRKYITS